MWNGNLITSPSHLTHPPLALNYPITLLHSLPAKCSGCPVFYTAINTPHAQYSLTLFSHSPSAPHSQLPLPTIMSGWRIWETQPKKKKKMKTSLPTTPSSADRFEFQKLTLVSSSDPLARALHPCSSPPSFPHSIPHPTDDRECVHTDILPMLP